MILRNAFLAWKRNKCACIYVHVYTSTSWYDWLAVNLAKSELPLPLQNHECKLALALASFLFLVCTNACAAVILKETGTMLSLVIASN